MADLGIFDSPIFREYILPFLLVFTLVFAILEKTQVLGEKGKARQINAIISLVVGFILIATPYARGIILNLMPVLAVALVIMFIFLMIYGFGGGNVSTPNKWISIPAGIIGVLVVIISVLYYSGLIDTLSNYWGAKQFISSLVVIIIVIIIVGVVLWEGKTENKTQKKEEKANK